MLNIESINDIREFIKNELLFTHEAASFLGISTQRLHQLVQTGKITPVKTSKAGSLFLKIDLHDRIKEMSFTGNNIRNEEVICNMRFGNDPTVIEEAINYFAIQSLFSFSNKKTKEAYEQLNLYWDVTEPFSKNFSEVSRFLGIESSILEKAYREVIRGFEELDENDHIIKRGQDLYPSLLEKTEQAPLFLFMRGNVRLTQYHAVSVVGTRNPTPDGEKKAWTLAALLGKHKIVVASGLAKGIDRAAHEGALHYNKPTIAVIGTPLTKFYPKENSKLQQQIAEEGLVISQFAPSAPIQRWNFPTRNGVMSGISLATVVIEAGETSGALIQADYALKQGRLVFIPQSALENTKLKWPQKYIVRPGASSFSKIDELMIQLQQSNVIGNNEKHSDQFIKEVGTKHVHRS